jgi:hypothetical protein
VKNDVYKCAWSFTLWNSNDPTCSLKISNHKGWPEACFYGGQKASTEALQLFDWLISETVRIRTITRPAGDMQHDEDAWD